MNRNYCGLLDKNYLDKRVSLCGWVKVMRVLKNHVFIKLKDFTGVIQLLFNKEKKSVFFLSKTLTVQSCINVKGIVRYKKIVLKDNKEIEVIVDYLKIFNYSKSLPVNLDDFGDNDNVKLKYRYLYLRNKSFFDVLKLRSKITFLIRKYFNKLNFIEVETPYLTKSFPEGARDYVVPSRLYKGKFYSLPQSPQLFKQLLMVGGLEKYYQIVKCFRDEDNRSYRQPEFTQVDIEFSFYDFNYLKYIVDNLVKKIFEFNDFSISGRISVIKYNDCIKMYGGDKPDLRNPIVFNHDRVKNFLNLNNLFFKEKYKHIVDFVLSEVNILFYINDIKKYLLSFGFCDIICFEIVDFVNNLFIYKFNDYLYFLNDKIVQKLFLFLNLKVGDSILIINCNKGILGNLFNIRNFFADKFNLLGKKNFFIPLWVINFPMFNIDKGIVMAEHHAFTRPLVSLSELKKCKEYSKILSSSYDLIINGYEIGSGSERISDYRMQLEIFDILYNNKKYLYEKYNFFVDSLKYGTPPHMGIALGLDRIIMLLANKKNIKDVIAFPKTTSGLCLLTDSPD